MYIFKRQFPARLQFVKNYRKHMPLTAWFDQVLFGAPYNKQQERILLVNVYNNYFVKSYDSSTGNTSVLAAKNN